MATKPTNQAAAAGSRSFSKDKRVRRNAAFVKIYAAGRRFQDSCLALVVFPRPDSPVCRMGLSVSRKVGNAVVRNRLKRRLREIYRLNQQRLKTGYDVVTVGRPPAAKLGYEALQACFLKLCTQAGVLADPLKG